MLTARRVNSTTASVVTESREARDRVLGESSGGRCLTTASSRSSRLRSVVPSSASLAKYLAYAASCKSASSPKENILSEGAAPGFGLANMTDVEDDALDRCYSESGQDTTCVLAACTHV
jgi:hypothetical protein